jgi:hypothetical protein
MFERLPIATDLSATSVPALDTGLAIHQKFLAREESAIDESLRELVKSRAARRPVLVVAA